MYIGTEHSDPKRFAKFGSKIRSAKFVTNRLIRETLFLASFPSVSALALVSRLVCKISQIPFNEIFSNFQISFLNDFAWID